MQQKNEYKGLINPAEYGLLKVAGQDAAKLLQGQITYDIQKALPNQFCLAAHCNPQGRVISLFRLCLLDETYYLLLPRSMVDIALSALKKYAVFYKVEMSKADLAILPESIFVNEIKKLAENHLQPNASWKLSNLLAGIPDIYPETSAHFLPHELGLHKHDAISFNKGCYTGQEIIARMHYRGKLKKNLYTARILNVTPLVSGTAIYYQDQEKKIAGEIVDCYCEGYNQYIALILTDETLAKNQQLFVDNANCFFKIIN